MGEDVCGGLDMDFLLGLAFLDNFNNGVEGSVVVPRVSEILQTLFEEGGFEVLEEIDGLEERDCGVGDGGWRLAIGSIAAGDVGDGTLLQRIREDGGGKKSDHGQS